MKCFYRNETLHKSDPVGATQNHKPLSRKQLAWGRPMPNITSKEEIPFSGGLTMFTPIRGLILTVSALTGLACGDYSRPTSPALYNAELLQPTLRIQSSFAMLTSGTKAHAVKWGPAHSRVEQTASAVIGPDGGTLSLPGSDFSMTIPSGALAAPTTITVVAKAGSHVAYEMLPHGLRFSKPVTAVQGLQNTAIYGTGSGNAIRTAYLPEGSDSIDDNDSASPRFRRRWDRRE
jgi:ZU5 domain